MRPVASLYLYPTGRLLVFSYFPSSACFWRDPLSLEDFKHMSGWLHVDKGLGLSEKQVVRSMGRAFRMVVASFS